MELKRETREPEIAVVMCLKQVTEPEPSVAFVAALPVAPSRHHFPSAAQVIASLDQFQNLVHSEPLHSQW